MKRVKTRTKADSRGGEASRCCSGSTAFCKGCFFGLLDKSTYRLAVLEDDDVQRERLLEALKGYPCGEAFAVEEFSCSQDLEKRMEAVRFDVLLCDISLGSDVSADQGCEKAPADCQGIEFVRRHASTDGFMQVIYVSGYAEFCSEVYGTDHAWFLLKPVVQADFNRAMDKALDNLQRNSENPVGVVVDGDIVLVPPRSIAYLESHLRKVHIHTSEEVYETYSTLSKMEERLPKTFVRCHKSFLVNMDFAKKLERDRIVLTTGEGVPVSQRHRRGVREAFMAFLIDG